LQPSLKAGLVDPKAGESAINDSSFFKRLSKSNDGSISYAGTNVTQWGFPIESIVLSDQNDSRGPFRRPTSANAATVTLKSPPNVTPL
jgi:hypothetical protein